jgi:hypothetical protein
MIAVWRRKKLDRFEDGTEYVSAEVVDQDPGPNQVVPGFFYHSSSYLTKDDGFKDHEWDYMTKNSTNVRYEPFR